MRTTRITITRISSPPHGADINTELQYLAGSLGLFNPRDKDRSKFRVFIALLKVPSGGLSSDDLAAQLGLTRATVIHHIDALRDAGMVEHSQGRYVLRVDNLARLIEQIREDVLGTLAELEQLARRCDEELGLG